MLRFTFHNAFRLLFLLCTILIFRGVSGDDGLCSMEPPSPGGGGGTGCSSGDDEATIQDSPAADVDAVDQGDEEQEEEEEPELDERWVWYLSNLTAIRDSKVEADAPLMDRLAEQSLSVRHLDADQLCQVLHTIDLGHLYCHVWKRNNVTGLDMLRVAKPSRLIDKFEVMLRVHQEQIYELFLPYLDAYRKASIREKIDVFWWCGPCYGLNSGIVKVECCNTCSDVLGAYEQKGWALSLEDFQNIEQCNGTSEIFDAVPMDDFNALSEELLKKTIGVENSGVVPEWYALDGNTLYSPSEPFIREGHRTKEQKQGLLPFRPLQMQFELKMFNGTVIFPFQSALIIPKMMVSPYSTAVSRMRVGEEWRVIGNPKEVAVSGFWPFDESLATNSYALVATNQMDVNPVIATFRVMSVHPKGYVHGEIPDRPHEIALEKLLNATLEKMEFERQKKMEKIAAGISRKAESQMANAEREAEKAAKKAAKAEAKRLKAEAKAKAALEKAANAAKTLETIKVAMENTDEAEHSSIDNAQMQAPPDVMA